MRKRQMKQERKNRRNLPYAALTLAALMTICHASAVFAGTWQKDEKGWRFQQDDGSYVQDVWKWIDGNQDGVSEYYRFGTDSYLYTDTKTPDGCMVNADGAWMENGVVQTQGTLISQAVNASVEVPEGSWLKGQGENADKWWWKNTDGSYPSNRWIWLDGNRDGVAEYYYFDANGWLIVSGMTPDGNMVDADGKWTLNGAVQTQKANRKDAVGPGGGTGTSSAGGPGGGSGSGGSSGGGGGSSSGGGGSSSGGSSGGSYTDDDISFEEWSDSDWDNYSDDSVSGAANDFKNANFGMMSDSQWKKTKEAIEEFKDEYITSDMSDFEKEIKIIEWLVENCTYEKGESWSRATAYSCIVLGKAQCSGYADAFLQTAKLCGLDVRYVYNKTHAWNLIKLDGDWYHVDVTWEDPIGSNAYGFGNLRNMYINLEDDQIQNVTSHRNWNPSSVKAKGIKYGPKVVENYMKTGKVDTSLGVSYKDQTDAFFEKVKNSADSVTISYTNVNDTANKVAAYLSNQIDQRMDTYEVLIRYGNTFPANEAKSYNRVSAATKQIQEIVNQKINAKYGTVLAREMKIYLPIDSSSGAEYYNYWHASISYKPGYGLQVPYTIHYICDGKEVGTQKGTGERNQYTAFQIPEPYRYIVGQKDAPLKGKATSSSNGIRITGRTEVEINIRVSDTTMAGYTIHYYKRGSNTPLKTVTGKGKIGSSITPEILEFEGYIPDSDVKTYTLKANSSNNTFSVYYAKKCNYTIKYVCDTDGETLETINGVDVAGKRLTIKPRSFENHTRKPSQSMEYTLPKEGDGEFTVHYTRDMAQWGYTIQYVDEETQEILKTVNGTGRENGTVSIPKERIDGYEPSDAVNTWTVYLVNENQVIQVPYTRQYSYTIRHIRKDTEYNIAMWEKGTVKKNGTIHIEPVSLSQTDQLEYESGAGDFQVTKDGQEFIVYYKYVPMGEAQVEVHPVKKPETEDMDADLEKKTEIENVDSEKKQKTENADLEEKNVTENTDAESGKTQKTEKETAQEPETGTEKREDDSEKKAEQKAETELEETSDKEKMQEKEDKQKEITDALQEKLDSEKQEKNEDAAELLVKSIRIARDDEEAEEVEEALPYELVIVNTEQK